MPTRPRRPAPLRPVTSDVVELHDRLLRAYGPQRWWPGDSPFEVIVGAILTQNTSWSNVEKAIGAMKSAGIRDIEAILATQPGTLARVIRSSGYYNQKARKLIAFAELVQDEYDGDLERFLRLPASALRQRLLGVWGIGEETADDIVLYAAGEPSFVIDAYTRRIVDRLGWRTGRAAYGDYQALFMERLPPDPALFNEFHALLVAHGKTICRPVPACDGCCLLDICPTASTAGSNSAT